MEGETEYAFWHALVRDVAYGALPRAARVAKHRAAAAWIAARSGGVNGRTAEIVAEHYVRALELASALGASADDLDAIRDPLVDALMGAADHAMGTSPAQAAVHARRALDQIGPDDPRRADALTTHGLAVLDVGHYPDARQSLEEARSLLVTKGGAVAAASIAVPLSNALAEAGDAARASAMLDEARVALAESPGPTLLEVMAAQAMMAVRAGEPHAAGVLGRRIVELSEELGILPPPRALTAIGGDANYVRAIEIADTTGDLRLSSRCRYNFSVHFRGRAAAWLDVINDSIAFDRTHGITNFSTYNLRASVSFNFLGRSAGVIDDLESIIAQAREIGDAFTEVQAWSSLVEIRAVRGEPVGPLDKLIAGWEAVGFGAGLEWTLAKVALANGDHGATRSLLTALLDAGLEVETPWLFVDHCLVADDRALAGRAAAAYRSDAATRHATSPDHITLERAADDALAGRLAEADGDLEVARDRYERAWRTFAEYGWDTPAGMVRGWLGRCLLDQGEVTAAVEQSKPADTLRQRSALPP